MPLTAHDLRPLLRPEHEELVGAGFRTANFGLAPGELPHGSRTGPAAERAQFRGPGIEVHTRAGAPVADPHHIGLIDIEGIRLRAVTGQVPACPELLVLLSLRKDRR